MIRGASAEDAPLGDQYYSLKVKVVEASAGTFRAVGRIVRKDTLEAVGGTMSFGLGERETGAACLAQMAADLPRLPRPPFEWGLTERRGVVQAYREYNEGLTRISRDLQQERASGTLSEEVLHGKLVDLVGYVSGQVISLGRRVEALNESDRNALAATPQDFVDDGTSLLNIDEIDARLAICSLYFAGRSVS